MKKMNKVQKVGMALAFSAMSAGSAFAEGADAASLITSAQGQIVTVIGLLSAAAIAVITAKVGYKVIPFVGRIIGGLFSGK